MHFKSKGQGKTYLNITSLALSPSNIIQAVLPLKYTIGLYQNIQFLPIFFQNDHIAIVVQIHGCMRECK